MKKEINTGIYMKAKKILSKILVIILNTNFIYSVELYTAKGRSIGDSFISISDEAESLVYNPAGAVYTEKMDLIIEYEDLLPGIRKNLSLARHLFGGVSFLNLNKEKIYMGLAIAQFATQIYKENIYMILTSKDITSLILKDKNKQKDIKVSLGLRFKYINFMYPQNDLLSSDPLFENFGREKSIFSLDLGILYTTKEIYYYGFTINDLFEPNIGLQDISYLKRKIILAFAYKYMLPQKKLTLLPSFGLRNYFNKTDFSVGAELTYKESYFLRATYSSWNIAVGVGYEYKNRLQINYSYVILNELEAFGGHYVSLSYKFLPSKIEPVSKTVQQQTQIDTFDTKKLNEEKPVPYNVPAKQPQKKPSNK